MSEQAREYYSELLDLPPENAAALVEPALIFGRLGDMPLGVRHLEDRHVAAMLEQRLQAATAPLMGVAARRLPPLHGVDGEHYSGYPSYGKLRRALVGPKRVTGQLLQLVLRPVAPEELPPDCKRRFDTLADTPLATQRPIEGYDIYYRVMARLKAGGRLATTACAAHVSPAVHKKLNKHYKPEHPNGTVMARTEVLVLDPRAVDAEEELARAAGDFLPGSGFNLHQA
jgi:hypothetical protein